MTKVNTYEGNSIQVSRTYVTSTTLAAFDVTFTMKQNKEDGQPLITVIGEVTGTGVVFNVPPLDDAITSGIYYFEVTAESDTQKITLEQDRLFVRESIVYIT